MAAAAFIGGATLGLAGAITAWMALGLGLLTSFAIYLGISVLMPLAALLIAAMRDADEAEPGFEAGAFTTEQDAIAA